MSTLHVNGLDLYYEERGAGAPLVLLHGFAGCTKTWEPFVDELAARHRLILVDLRGHGRSSNPSKEFTHGAAADDVLQLLDALGLARVFAMGISTGGMTLLHLVTRQPARVEAMVLISATTHFTAQAKAIFRRASFATLPEEVRAMYRTCASRGEEQVRELIAQFNAFAKNDDDMSFSAERLAGVKTRTLVVHGDRDQFFPVDIPLTLYQSLPNAELWIVPGGEHVPIYDRAVPFTATALRFLAG